ncbi:SGNH/GDSL hydrolase family protein [Micromonospora sp. NPDC005299]|uniref:SGNH/GDSL hydrolase family protein n=1 Tax=Micromonospora sp. NPDC005299 TaxID=3364231 RepID=UPI00369DC6ED
MARLIGPDEASREVKVIVGDAFKSKRNRPATVYSDAAATQLADILWLDGSPVAGSVVTIDAYSMLPLVQFPDGVDTLWVVVDNGPAWPVYARTDDRLDALAGRVTVVEGTAGAAETPTGAQAKANAAQAAAIASSSQRAANLSDLASTATARTNLGLGGAATLGVGTTAGTVAAGDAPGSVLRSVAQWGHRWAFIGDSITNGSAATNGAYAYAPRAIALAGHSLIRPDSFEAGVAGERSDQMLARLAAVETSGATSFFVLAGTNDAAQGVSLTSYASTMTQIITRLRALGRVLVGTVPPRAASAPAAQHTSTEGYNAWLRVFAPMFGAQVVDVWAALADTTTGRLASAYDSGDGTHPNDLGHLRIARVVAAAIRGSGPAWPGWVTSEGQPGNLIADALCDSGSVRPSGWFEWPGGTGTAPTYSLATDTTGRLPAGRWAQVDIDAAAATVRTLSSPATPVAAGDRLALCLLAEVDDVSGNWESAATAVSAVNIRVVDQVGAQVTSALTTRPVGYVIAPGTYRLPPLLWPFTVPAGMTSANIWLQHTMSAGQHFTFRYGCIGLVNLTTLGMQSLLDFGSNSMVSLA